MTPKIIPKGSRQIPLTRTQKVIRLLYFSPLIAVFLERLWIPLEYGNLSGYLDVDTAAATRTVKMSHLLSHESLPSLEKLTKTTNAWTSNCPSMEILTNVHDSMAMSTGSRIPRIVHQTARSRCATAAFVSATKQWKLPGYSYYFHDDEAINRVFRLDFPEFPQLKVVIRNCVKNPTIKADLWRYLILWLYGGVYADFDSAPAKFNEKTIQDDDDGFFVVEQYHILSQWFMAVSPRHPLMYYAVQNTLLNLMETEDTLKIGAHLVSGPHALHKAYQDFRRDANVLVEQLGTGFKPVWRGTFQGTNNRTVTVAGKGENENDYVHRMAIDAITRSKDYRKMGMTHFSAFTHVNAKKSGQSCYDAMLADVMEAA